MFHCVRVDGLQALCQSRKTSEFRRRLQIKSGLREFGTDFNKSKSMPFLHTTIVFHINCCLILVQRKVCVLIKYNA